MPGVVEVVMFNSDDGFGAGDGGGGRGVSGFESARATERGWKG